MSRMTKFPRISVITPSFNQAEFLERTILSVLDQGYPNLEYIIVDGGSTDGSVDIIRKYETKLAWWVSEKDGGQVDALNKGFKRATGDWLAWQNSDDIYYPDAFHKLAEASKKYPDADLIIGDINLIDELDKPFRTLRYVTPSHNSLIAEGMILSNQAAFWRKDLSENSGELNLQYHCAFDFDWFLRITADMKRGIHCRQIMGALRYHEATKGTLQRQVFHQEYDVILTGRKMSQMQKYLYMLRRWLLLMRQGDIGYVLRGIKRRIFRSPLGNQFFDAP